MNINHAADRWSSNRLHKKFGEDNPMMDPSNRSRGVGTSSTIISVQFAPMQRVMIHLKYRPEIPLPPKITPVLFHIVACLDCPTWRPTAGRARLTAKAPVEKVGGSYPQRLEHPLQFQPASARNEKPIVRHSSHVLAKRPEGRSESVPNKQTPQIPAASSSGFRKREFKLEAPQATFVKLAADFTDWEKHPLDLIKGENGTWSIMVWLSPGQHACRFIVDNQWHDDPDSIFHRTNPIGSTNAVVQIT